MEAPLFLCYNILNNHNNKDNYLIKSVFAVLQQQEVGRMAADKDKRAVVEKIAGDQAAGGREDGNPHLVEQTLSAEQIEELKKSVTSLLDNMPALTFSKDANNGKYLICNRKFAEYAGKKTPAEVAGLTDFDIFDKATAVHFAEDDKIALFMDKPHVFYEDVPDASGYSRHFQTTKLKYTNASGKLCLLGMSVDVTQVVAEMSEAIQEKAEVQEAYKKARYDNATYSSIVRALSADYTFLYYVNLETDRFVEYNTGLMGKEMAEARREGDFFNASRRDARKMLHPADQEIFLKAFTKENILRSIDKYGTFTLTYRLLVNGVPSYVNMKATRMKGDEKHIIIGVNNVDAQMKYQEEAERIQEERITYARMTALAGDYIGIYTVDPVTDYYVEYSASRDYEGLGLTKEGHDFFGVSRAESGRAICPEDLDRFLSMFTKEKIMAEIEQNGIFELTYRLMMEGTPTYVSLKAALVKEKEGPRLIVGVSNIDARVKREQEYANNLTEARNRANIDALTGVKNKFAYANAEAHLNGRIGAGEPVAFAVSICDINGLKKVNDEQGHQAGDRYIREGCMIICKVFAHSPVFRVGGDEFAVISQGADYENIDSLVEKVAEINAANRAAGKVVIACGMSKFNSDQNVAEVFKRADAHMYENKKKLKGL